MQAPFEIGEVVICVDAADISSPPWHPLECGHMYTIRDIARFDGPDVVHDKNIHKNCKWVVWLMEIHNMSNRAAAMALGINPISNNELGYAATRFEKMDSEMLEETIDVKAEEVA
jgi:hypothetical protein